MSLNNQRILGSSPTDTGSLGEKLMYQSMPKNLDDLLAIFRVFFWKEAIFFGREMSKITKVCLPFLGFHRL
jgi:hypothetical protein